MERYETALGNVDVYRAWHVREVERAVRDALAQRRERLPADKGARILIKPNLNNDLLGLTGNSADLRVLCSLIEGLRDFGYTNLTVADGANVGVERRNIDVFKRLRVRSLRDRYGVRIVDLNRDVGRRLELEAGAHPQVARTVLDADFIISVPKVKTHAEAGLSCACKNWVGICVAQDKRHMHYDLAKNIARIAGLVPPDLILVDGLIGMQGNGPGDGDPFRLGVIVASDNPWANDLVVAKLVGFPWREIGYLVHGLENGNFTEDIAAGIEATVPTMARIVKPPPRSKLAVLSERKELLWLKRAVRPLVSRPAVTELAYRAKIVQDVYFPEDDTVTSIRRNADACGECRKCEAFCPTKLSVEEIGVRTDPESCINCLYCWLVCPNDAIALDGELNFMERQVQRYKKVIEAL